MRRYSVSQNLNEGHILNCYTGKEKKYVSILNVLTLQPEVDILGARETRGGKSVTTAEGYFDNYHFKINWLCNFSLNRIELTGLSFMLISDA